MRYVLSAAGASLLAHTVRYICGNLAGLCTLLLVALCSMIFDKTPLLFLTLSCFVWAGVRVAGNYTLQVLHIVPTIALAVLLTRGGSAGPVLGLFLADLIAVASLAYRGWINKRLVD